MKGQNRLFMEIMIFGIGIIILGFVTDNFTNVGSFIGESSVELQASGVLNLITSAIAKTSIPQNSEISVSIPDDFSGLSYQIKFLDDRVEIKTKNNQTFAKKIFKQALNYTIITESDIIDSSTDSITIRKQDDEIFIEATN